MTTTTIHRRLTAVLAAATVLATALAGCTPAVRDESGPAPTPTASAGVFACPSGAQVAGLTAIPFAQTSSTAQSCSYTSGSGDLRAEVRIRHGGTVDARGLQTLAVPRAAAERDGQRIRAAADLSAGAFTAGSASDCSAWVYATDGVVTRVSARRGPASSASACAVARSTAVVMGTAAAAAAPVVSVIASKGLFDAASTRRRWQRGLADDLDGRVVLTEQNGTGWAAKGSTGFTAAAARVDPASAAVVVLCDGVPAGEDDLNALRRLTTTLSAAGAAAPRARLIVVGPVSGADRPTTALTELRSELRTATRIAGAAWIDPADGAETDGSASTDAQVRTAAASVLTALLAERPPRADGA